MPDILVRDLPEYAVRHLKERAARNHRSLQAEVKATLLDSVQYTREEFMEVMRRIGEQMPTDWDPAEVIREGREERMRTVLGDTEDDECDQP